MITQQIPGGWSGWNFAPTPAEIQVFGETLGKLIGVKYVLIACRTQVVEGTNYEFIATSTSTLLVAPTNIVEAAVYMPLSGKPVIEHIGPTLPPVATGLPGGWQSWQHPASAAALAALAKIHIVGANYKGYASTNQVVNGTNYCLLCSQTFVTVPNAPVNAVMVHLYEDTKGNVTLTGIDPIKN